jgi:hypothetical protein
MVRPPNPLADPLAHVRQPLSPARALLRAIDADPFTLARVLNWHLPKPLEEPGDWWAE